MKYETTITKLGNDSLIFLNDKDTNFIIIFNENAPPELADISILHTISDLKENLNIGDTIEIGKYKFKIEKIGTEAEHTLKTLGHCTLTFNKNSDNFLPGQILLSGDKLPEISIGDKIRIY